MRADGGAGAGELRPWARGQDWILRERVCGRLTGHDVRQLWGDQLPGAGS
uniref:Uncharacterized protein n=1 Tax=Arundo donax TaxID=35708 RepID=A0A0A9HH38_ARUDO